MRNKGLKNWTLAVIVGNLKDRNIEKGMKLKLKLKN
jgi:hypothetical protein